MPAEYIIESFLRAESLKRLQRSGWEIAGVTVGRQESIAEHSWGTAFLAWLIGIHVSEERTDLDLCKVLAMAILHDLPEALTTDIPHSAVLLGGSDLKAGKVNAEMRAIEDLLEHISKAEGIGIDLLEELRHAESFESRIVLSADILDMLLHAIALERNGVASRFFDPFFNSGVPRVISFGIPLAISIAQNLLNEHHEH